jgi:purine nucleosidase
MPRKVILDTDPGIDDSMALLLALASPELELLAVTTVYGNHLVEQTTRNALCLLEAAGRLDIPVAAGAAAPLARPYRGPRGVVHGEDGLGNAGWASAGQPLAAPETAASLIARLVLEQPGEVTLLAVGPLTNLALALRLEPRLAPAVRQVIVMGGAFFRPGNATPVAEANIFNDPDAAAHVLAAPWPVTMVGLDVTMQTVMDQEFLDLFARASGAPAALIHRMMPVYMRWYRQRFDMDNIPTHDPSAIAYAIDPNMFQTRRVPVHVETEGRCAGQTVPDPRRLWPGLAEVDVCVGVDSPRVLKLIRERLAV